LVLAHGGRGAIIIIIIIIINHAEIKSDTVTLKVFQGHFKKLYYITVSLSEKRWQTVLSSISGGTHAVTGRYRRYVKFLFRT